MGEDKLPSEESDEGSVTLTTQDSTSMLTDVTKAVVTPEEPSNNSLYHVPKEEKSPQLINISDSASSLNVAASAINDSLQTPSMFTDQEFLSPMEIKQGTSLTTDSILLPELRESTNAYDHNVKEEPMATYVTTTSMNFF